MMVLVTMIMITGGDGRRNDIKLKQMDSKYLEMYGYIEDLLFVVGKSPVFNHQAP